MTKTTQLPAHSKLGASSYDRWKSCPGSIRMSVGCPEQTSVYAAEGSLAHEVAEFILTSKKPGLIPQKEVTDEMLEAVQVYIDYIETLRKKPGIELVECKFHLDTYHPDLFGTSDYVRYIPSEKVLHVVDYKHGAGVEVDVLGNLQLRYYALGALHAMKKPVDKVVITIVQPRCYSKDGAIRTEVIDSVELVEFGFQLVEDALATQKPDAPIIPGDHCRWCPANAVCEGPRQAAIVAAQSSFPDLTEEEAVYGYSSPDPKRVAEYLSMIPRVEAWVTAVQEYAKAMAEKGHAIPGYTLVDKSARRKWAEDTSPNQIAKELGLGISEVLENKLKSPAQIEKIIKKDSEKLFVLDQLVVKESSGKTLVPDVVKTKSASSIDKMFK